MRITLVGYRASGKSTVGLALGGVLGVRFVDADRALETRLGCTIAEFFARSGEAPMREHEAACLSDLLAGDDPQVLATGGGCVLRSDNRSTLRRDGGLVVYLHAGAAALSERLRRDQGNRPSLTGQPVADEVAALLAVRDPLYRKVATSIVDATLPVGEVVAEIAALARERR